MKCIGFMLATVLSVCLVPTSTETQERGCRIVEGVMRLQELPEASGLAASRRTPGVLWSHNDSGEPIVFALTTTGTVQGRVRLTGAQVEDWEDIAVGSCPQGTCLYVADIGDNNAKRRRISIYRTPEPAPSDTRTANVEVLHLTYPDGPQDAEALIVLPGGDLFIVTKGNTGAVALYRVPTPFRNGLSVSLTRVAVLVPAKGKGKKGTVDSNQRITDADASPNGRWIVLRTANAVQFYDASEFVTGKIKELFRYSVADLREPQGEGVALSGGADLWVAGEGRGKSRPGTLAQLMCTLP